MPRVFFKVINVYTSFHPKLSKCCHEITVDNVGDRLLLSKKVVISKKKLITFLAVTYNTTRDQYEEIHVAVVPRNLFSFFIVPTDKKSLRNTAVSYS